MKHQGSCHCGKVKFEVTGDFSEAISCNCSICQRKGTLLAFIPESQFHLISGENALTDYQFGRKAIHHYFCSTCGVTSFASGQTPDGKKMQSFNHKAASTKVNRGLEPHAYNPQTNRQVEN